MLFTAKKLAKKTQILFLISSLVVLLSCGGHQEVVVPTSSTKTQESAGGVEQKTPLTLAPAVLKRELYEELNADPIKPYPHVFDRTDEYGSRLDYQRQVLYLLRTRSFGKSELVSQVSVKDGAVTQEVVVKKPSYTHYKLESAQGIVVH